jgi:hypothetical protein
MQYSLFAVLTVAIGLFGAKDWPPLTGDLEAFTTIREIWGKFWHQLLRRVCNLAISCRKSTETDVVVLEAQHAIPNSKHICLDSEGYIDIAVLAIVHGIHYLGFDTPCRLIEFNVEYT